MRPSAIFVDRPNRQRPPASPQKRAAFAVAALSALLLGACGFRPMYGERNTGSATASTAAPMTDDLASVEVAPIADRRGQILRNELTSLLNPAAVAAADKRYTLRIRITETVDTFAVERSGFTTTANVEITGIYTLVEDATGNAVLGGSSRAISNYNILENDYSTYVAGGDARNRAITQLAYEIRNRLALHFAQAPPNAAASAPAPAPAPALAPTSTSSPALTSGSVR